MSAAYVPGHATPAGRRSGEPDEAGVERAIAGDRSLPTAPVDRGEAVARLTALGMSGSEIARRLGVSTRTVARWRAKRRDDEPGDPGVSR